MNKGKNILYIFAGIILLLPVIFFPITTDLSIFIQSGQIIAQGGKPYVDFIDIKPPAIYYVYSLIYYIVGNGETSLRLFDFFIQILTIFYLFYFVKKQSGNSTWAGISVIFYSLSYTVLAHNQTMQIESWIPLLSLFMLTFALKSDKNNLNIFLTGIIAGIITALKFSIFFIIFLIPLADYFSGNYNIKQIIKRFAISFAGFLLIILVSLLPFLDTSIRNGFADVLTYMSIYAKYPPMNNAFIRLTLKSLAEFFGDKYSLLFSLLLFTGIFYSIKKYVSKKNSGLSQFVNISVAALLLLMISVVVEKKFFPYHFSRLYALFAVFTAAGAIYFQQTLQFFRKERKQHILTIVLISLFFLILSPLPRWISLINPTVNYFSDKNKYELYYTRNNAMLLKKQRAVALYLKRHCKPNEKALVVSVASSIINYYLGNFALNKFMLSAFFISSANIELWKNEAYQLLKKSSWLVLRENDPSYLTNAHFMSSRAAFFHNRTYVKYFINNFQLVKVIGPFYIYKKNKHQQQQ